MARASVAAIVALLFAVVLGACAGSTNKVSGDGGGGNEGASRFDKNDPRALAGFSDLIFVGTVLKKVGDKKTGPIAGSQYEVALVDKLKGLESGGPVIVNQIGGSEDGSEADKPLSIGATYLLATRKSIPNDWYTIASVVGDARLSAADIAATNRSLGADTTDPSIVKNMRDAIANEIPFKSKRPPLTPSTPSAGLAPSQPEETSGSVPSEPPATS